MCFPVNILKFFRAPILKNICEPLLLNFITTKGKILEKFLEDSKWKSQLIVKILIMIIIIIIIIRRRRRRRRIASR